MSTEKQTNKPAENEKKFSKKVLLEQLDALRESLLSESQSGHIAGGFSEIKDDSESPILDLNIGCA